MVLGGHLRTEETVVYSLVLIRKILESSGRPPEFQTLHFYCSWPLHIHLREEPARRLVRAIDAELERTRGPIWEFDPHFIVGSILNFDLLHRELASFIAIPVVSG